MCECCGGDCKLCNDKNPKMDKDIYLKLSRDELNILLDSLIVVFNEYISEQEISLFEYLLLLKEKYGKR